MCNEGLYHNKILKSTNPKILIQTFVGFLDYKIIALKHKELPAYELKDKIIGCAKQVYTITKT